MDRIETWGGIPLSGEVTIQGSKNAALPLMAAAVLFPGRTVLGNCPRILDVEYMSRILRELGCAVSREGSSLVIDAGDVRTASVSAKFATRMRASVVLMGSLLGRFGRAYLPYPGGCTIGRRPIDLHLQTFAQMGVDIRQGPEGISLEAPDGLQGCEIMLPFPSVGATENAILGAVRAKNVTVLKGCAREPEIVELCRFLTACGADVEGAGTSVLTIRGRQDFREIEYELMADRIVAGTYLLAVAGTRGTAVLRGADPAQLGALTDVLRMCGARIEGKDKNIRIDASQVSAPAGRVDTAPYPGFPTDLQSQMLVLFCGLPGKNEIRENLFESRFQVVRELRRMGADIQVGGSRAVVRGPAALSGAEVAARELRGGAALVAAGLTARGRTVISGGQFIRRGYEDICRDLSQLGAQIREI